jgi:hypothetical protein
MSARGQDSTSREAFSLADLRKEIARRAARNRGFSEAKLLNRSITNPL